MKPPPVEPRPGNDEPSPKLTRLEAARRIIEEYAADLREIMKKLRRMDNIGNSMRTLLRLIWLGASAFAGEV